MAGSDVVVKHTMGADDVAAVLALGAAAEAADGRPALDDHHRLELIGGARPGFAAIEAWDGDHLSAYAQLSRGNDAWDVQLVVDPPARNRLLELGTAVLRPALDLVRAGGGGDVHWWAFEPTPDHAALAARLGFLPRRQLHQLRRPLPTGLPVTISTRPFVVGRDEEAWLAVNNRAFSTHPEQGGWDLDTLRAREKEPWFTPEGFLLYEGEDGRLLGFCWTKVHAESSPVLGEIYVIAVDPDASGRGLGKELTLAGLAALANRGVPVGMLYVDGANAAALGMYRSLGFEVHATTTAFGATL